VKMVIILSCSYHAALMMSVLREVDVEIVLFGQHERVKRTTEDPTYLRALGFYALTAYWLLEFVTCISKYIAAQLFCAHYFQLPSVAPGTTEETKDMTQAIPYSIYSVGYHLGSLALGAFLQLPLRTVRTVLRLFLPDRPNLGRSNSPIDRVIYHVFYPIIQLDLHLLRFFSDATYVMIALKGYSFFSAARRAEGLLNRSRGKIPNLTKFTYLVDLFLNTAMGFLAVVWTFFFFREPRAHGFLGYSDVLDMGGAVNNLVKAPAHSAILAMPVMFAFGLWIGQGMMHILTMSSETLTMCYCIDVEMAGGTETDALYVPPQLATMYKDMGGSESEREMAQAMQGMAPGAAA